MKPGVSGLHKRQGFVILLTFFAVSARAAHPLPVSSALNLYSLQTPAAAAESQQSSKSSADAQVIMNGIRFQPPELAVRAGETVEWKNEDIVSHTVTADDGSFDSGLIPPGGTWKMTVKSAGSLEYHCRPHPNMKAKLVATNGTQSPQPQTNTGFRLPALTPPRSPQELHPILVNFTAALLPLALLSDLLGLWTRRTSLHAAASWMVLYAAIITPLTGIAGWWWKSRSGGALPANLITVHQWLGTSLVLVFVVLAVWRWRIHKRNQVPSIAYLLFAGITVLALIYQGSLGGAMAFGR
jgi:plastocyanin/uncharacterized membrane protein